MLENYHGEGKGLALNIFFKRGTSLLEVDGKEKLTTIQLFI